MPRYKFTGESPETFPTIVTENGSLVLKPGQTVDLPDEVEHARLKPVKAKATKKGSHHAGVFAVDQGVQPVDETELDDPAGINDDPDPDVDLGDELDDDETGDPAGINDQADPADTQEV